MQDYPSCTNRFVKIGKSVASVNVFQRSSVLCHLEQIKDQAVAIKRLKIRVFCCFFFFTTFCKGWQLMSLLVHVLRKQNSNLFVSRIQIHSVMSLISFRKKQKLIWQSCFP